MNLEQKLDKYWKYLENKQYHQNMLGKYMNFNFQF